MARVARRRAPSRRSRPPTEVQLIERLRRGFAQAHPAVELGIGDDAAIVRNKGGRLVWSADCVVDGVHFRRDWVNFVDVGWRSLQAAASDLAAMGAKPLAALSCWVLDSSLTDRDLRKLTQGQKQASKALSLPIVGGNISSGSELSITTSVLGEVKRPLLRSGALAGDELWLCGEVGLAAAGQRVLLARRRRPTTAERRCVAAFRRPLALIAQGLALVSRASAAIDVSDGLVKDASEISRASRVCVCIDEAKLGAAISQQLVDTAKTLGVDPLRLALYGGDDYALLAAGPKPRRPRRAKVIGRIDKGHGVMLVAGGKQKRLMGGYDHLRRQG